jgi:hypothetical protein
MVSDLKTPILEDIEIAIFSDKVSKYAIALVGCPASSHKLRPALARLDRFLLGELSSQSIVGE